jgi:hypothetical protein
MQEVYYSGERGNTSRPFRSASRKEHGGRRFAKDVRRPLDLPRRHAGHAFHPVWPVAGYKTPHGLSKPVVRSLSEIAIDRARGGSRDRLKPIRSEIIRDELLWDNGTVFQKLAHQFEPATSSTSPSASMARHR